jgi:hypothetical protein
MRPLERPRRRWGGEGNIIMDLKEIVINMRNSVKLGVSAHERDY